MSLSPDKGAVKESLSTPNISLNDMFEHVLECVSRLDKNNHFLNVNDVYANKLGYSKEEMVGMSFYESIHPDDVEFIKLKFQELVANGRVEIEVRGLKKDKSTFYQQIVLAKGLESDSSSVHHYCFMKDVTDRVLNEHQLIDSVKLEAKFQEQQFHSLMQNIPGVVFRCNVSDHWSFEYLGEGIEKITGFGVDEILHAMTSYASLVHPDDLEKAKQVIDSAVSDKHSYVIEYRILNKDNNEVWVRERASCTCDEKGNVRWIDGFIRDIGSEKNKEKELKISSALIENSVNAAFWLTQDGRIIYANAAADKLLGYASGELLTVSLSDIDSTMLLEKRRHILQSSSEDKTTTFETTLETKDRRQILVEVTASHLQIGDEFFTCCTAQDVSQRIQARLFEKITQSSNDKIAFIDCDYVYRAVNSSYASAFGLDKEMVVGRYCVDIVGQDRFNGLIKEQLDVCLAGKAVEFKDWLSLPKAGNRYYHVKYTPLLEHEKVTGAVLLLSDLTHIIKTEEALYDSEKKFSQAFETSPDIMMFTRLSDGKPISVNRAFTKLTGYSFDDVVGKPSVESYADIDDRKIFVERLKKEGNCYNFESHIYKKSGGKLPVLLSANLIELQGEQCIFSVARDISEIKTTERVIRESHQKFEELIDDINVIVWEMVLPEIQFTFVSEPAERILGYPIEQWYEKNFWIDHVHPDDKEYASSYCFEATQQGKDHQFEYRMFDNQGKEVWVKDIIHVVKDENGQPAKLRGVILDVTERKNNEIAVERKNRALSVLSKCNAAVANAGNEDQLLQSICDIITSDGGYDFAWVGYAQQDKGKTIQPVKFAGNEDGFLSNQFSWAEGETGNGPISIAIRSKKTHVIRNMHDTGEDTSWKMQALSKGYHSAIGLPLAIDGKVFAALVIVCSVIDSFDEEECKLLESLAENLVFGIQSIREIEKRRQAEGLLALENHALQLIASSPSFEELLNDITRHMEMKLEGSYCSILLLSEDGLRLKHGAAPSLPDEYNKAVDGIEIGACVGSCGTAAYLNKQVIVSNIDTAPLWDNFRGLAKRYNLKACHSTPIRDTDGNVIATFANYYQTVKEPTVEELRIVDRMTHIISSAIERRNTIETIRKSEECFTMAMQGVQDGLWDWCILTGELYMSPRWMDMLGYNEQELCPRIRTFINLVHPSDRRRVKQVTDDYLQSKTSKFEVGYRLRHKEGHYVEILSRGFGLRDKSEKIIRMVGTHVDITERKRTELLIQESEKRFRSLYDDTPSMFFTLDEDGKILSANRFGAVHLGYSVEELVNQSIFDIADVMDRQVLQDSMAACAVEPNKLHHCEFRQLHKHKEIIWVRATLRLIGENGSQTILVSCEDISETKILSEQLEYQAKHDSLTGLINRAEFERRLRRILSEDVPNGEHALCYLDLDQFKVINDTCGHLAGDELLRRISDLLNTVVRKRDTLARLGGDEFAVLLEHCPIEQAKRVAGELLGTIQSFRFMWEGKSFNLGVSIGLVPMQGDEGNLSDMLSAADEACYAAKDAGRNRVHIYHPDDVELSRRRGEMQRVGEINRALEEGRFRLAMQPMIYLGSDPSMKGENHCEVLLRMEDEVGNIIMPGAFLSAAERYNLSTKLDRWVVRTTFSWLLEYSGEIENLNCSINLSGHSLGDQDFLDFLLEQFKQEKISPEKICFEITETAAIANLGDAIKFIQALKEIGCHFALDDFGTGLSSFNYLKNLPVDFLKIDGSFVRDILRDPIDFAMVRSINEVGQVMGKKTIAEFVENDEILAALRDIGIDFAQGYGIGRPELLQFSIR